MTYKGVVSKSVEFRKRNEESNERCNVSFGEFLGDVNILDIKKEGHEYENEIK